MPIGDTVGIRAGKDDSLQGEGNRRRGLAQSEAGAVDGDQECPVCGYAAGTQSGVYLHLQIDHRKSELARTLLDNDE